MICSCAAVENEHNKAVALQCGVAVGVAQSIPYLTGYGVELQPQIPAWGHQLRATKCTSAKMSQHTSCLVSY